MIQVKRNFLFILIRDCNDTGQKKFLVHIDQGLNSVSCLYHNIINFEIVMLLIVMINY